MTTASRAGEARLRQVRKRLKELLPVLRSEAESLAPRPGFLVEPVVEMHTWVDPSDGEAKYEIVYFIIDGTREEWSDFHKAITEVFWGLTHEDRSLAEGATVSVVSAESMDAWRSIHKRT